MGVYSCRSARIMELLQQSATGWTVWCLKSGGTRYSRSI